MSILPVLSLIIPMLVTFAVYTSLAISSTRLNKWTDLPGTNILKWSFWLLAVSTVLIWIIGWSLQSGVFNTGGFDTYVRLLLIVIHIIPVFTAVYGYRKLVKALIAGNR